MIDYEKDKAFKEKERVRLGKLKRKTEDEGKFLVSSLFIKI